MNRGTLSTLMKIQMIAFLVYGVTFFLFPDFTLGTIFGFADGDLPHMQWPKVVGAIFLGVALAEYLTDRKLAERMDLVWPFVLTPGLLLVVFIWERMAGTYVGSELFYWVSIGVTAFFVVTVGGLRLRISE